MPRVTVRGRHVVVFEQVERERGESCAWSLGLTLDAARRLAGDLTRAVIRLERDARDEVEG